MDDAVSSDDEVPGTAVAALRPAQQVARLAPLKPDLEPDVRTFVEHLRVLFRLTELSVRRFATLHSSDAGTISRYLSGDRAVPTGFLKFLFEEIARAQGRPVTREVQEQTHALYLAALRARDQGAYQLQLAVDKVLAHEIALRESEVMVTALREAVAARESKLYDTEMARRALAAAAAAERLENAEEHARHDAERQRLIDEIAELQRQFKLAVRSRDRALAKVRQLEEELTALELIEDARRQAKAIRAVPLHDDSTTGARWGLSFFATEHRMRAVTSFAKSMAAAHSEEGVVRIAAREAQRHLRAAIASVSVWERANGRLRVLANHGRLARDESPFPDNEVWPVTAFPEIVLSEDDLGPWIQLADEEHGDPKRAAMLRRHGRYSALIAPIVYNGRAWGELRAARTIDQLAYDREDIEFAGVLAAQIAAALANADHVRHIERLAYTDELTGLRNRRSFDARLDAAIARHSSLGTAVSLLVCEVNGAKEMFDEHGRDHGDLLLVQFAGVISASAALLPGSLAAQYSGGEFCVLVEGYGADDAVRMAEELCSMALTVRGGRGLSCGVASTGDRIGEVTTRERLFRLADTARYRAERSGSLRPVVAGHDVLSDGLGAG